MPECQNCGRFVSAQYVRVRLPEGVTDPPACPHCPDAMIQDGEKREARSPAGAGTNYNKPMEASD